MQAGSSLSPVPRQSGEGQLAPAPEAPIRSGPTEVLPGTSVLRVQVGSQDFAIDVADIREIRSWVEPTPLPRAPHYVGGMINLRSSVIPVLNLGERLGLAPSRSADTSVIVVIFVHGQLVGLIVDAVCDLIPVPAEGVQPAPAVVDDPATRAVSGTSRNNGNK